MTETSASEPTPTPPCASEEILKLKCPSCGGGLNLKRKFLGLTGHCVHCQTPLTALGEIGAGEVQLFADTGAAGVEMAGSERESCDLARTAFPAVPGSTALTPLPTRLSDNLFPTAENPPNPFDLKTSPSSAPFGGDHASRGGSTVSAFALPGSEVSVMAGWGTNIPREVHASISPFGLKAHHGSGLAETLFREKIGAPLRNATELATPTAFGFPSGSAAIFGTTSPSGRLPVPTSRTTNHRSESLPGPGMILSSSREETTPNGIFQSENKDPVPGRIRWLLRAAAAMVIGLCLLSGAAVAISLMPEETRLAWKTRAIEWLEPGRPVLEHLPEEFHPEWASSREVGIDADITPIAEIKSLETP
jgi:hypothetical protein